MPKITFGIIVFNGEPFTSYCLRALYPFAYEIIVVEGACRAAAPLATVKGHSTDGTLETLIHFKQAEDPDDKVHIITQDAFWNEKDQMFQALAQCASGDYLWQVDIDEFYKPEDMQSVLEALRKDSEITQICFKQITFWGGFDYIVDGWLFRMGFAKYWAQRYQRLFKWGRGYQYISHRPPKVCNQKGEDLSNIKKIDADVIAGNNILLYHYSLLFPKQVREKCIYYKEVPKLWGEDRGKAVEWAQEAFLNLKKPYRVHNVYAYPSWLERFYGTHPLQIEHLRKDIEEGKIDIQLRPIEDIECLLRSPKYQFGKICLKMLNPLAKVASL